MAQARLWVALSVGAAGAGVLTELAPVVGLALAHTGGRFALASWMAGAGLTTVVAPVLAWTAGAALGSEESRFTSTEARLHTHLIFPADIRPLADGDGAFLIFLSPARTALGFRGAAACADVLTGWVERGSLGPPSPEQQQ